MDKPGYEVEIIADIVDGGSDARQNKDTVIEPKSES